MAVAQRCSPNIADTSANTREGVEIEGSLQPMFHLQERVNIFLIARTRMTLSWPVPDCRPLGISMTRSLYAPCLMEQLPDLAIEAVATAE